MKFTLFQKCCHVLDVVGRSHRERRELTPLVPPVLSAHTFGERGNGAKYKNPSSRKPFHLVPNSTALLLLPASSLTFHSTSCLARGPRVEGERAEGRGEGEGDRGVGPTRLPDPPPPPPLPRRVLTRPRPGNTKLPPTEAEVSS